MRVPVARCVQVSGLCATGLRDLFPASSGEDTLAPSGTEEALRAETAADLTKPRR